MFGSAVLESLIALAFLYLLLSVVCSSVNEFISRLFQLRHTTLLKGLGHLLADHQVRDKLMDHPLIKVLGPSPTHIPAKTFAMALLDLIAPAGQEVPGAAAATAAAGGSSGSSGGPAGAAETVTSEPPAEAASVDAKAAGGAVAAAVPADLAPPLGYEQVRQAIGNLPPSELRRSLLVLVDSADRRLDAVHEALSNWFDSTMDRASEWYKRRTHWILLVLAALVSVGSNADTLEVAESLWRDSGLRQGIVAAADGYIAAYQNQGITPQEQATTDPEAALASLTDELSSFQLSLGWQTAPVTAGGWLKKLLGLALTTLAVSLGAPFWFDVVNKVILARSPPPPPAEAKSGSAS